MASKPSSQNVLTTSQAASLLLLGAERVRQLEKEGWVEKVGRGKFLLIPLVQGYIRYLKDAERRASKSAASTRAQDLRTERAEFDLAVAKKEFLPREDMFAAADFISATVKNEMLGIPARATRDPELRAKLEEEVGNALNRIAKKIERATGTAVSGGDVFEGSQAPNT